VEVIIVFGSRRHILIITIGVDVGFSIGPNHVKTGVVSFVLIFFITYYKSNNIKKIKIKKGHILYSPPL